MRWEKLYPLFDFDMVVAPESIRLCDTKLKAPNSKKKLIKICVYMIKKKSLH